MTCSVILRAETSEADGDEESVAHLRRHVTDVMDALADHEESDVRLSDADMSVNLTGHEATFSIVVEAASLDEAVAIGQAAPRSAIHEAGGFTRGGEKHWSVGLGKEDDDRALAIT